ncbi:MAG: hypothetical protein ABIG08_01230 [bacterium]
MSDLPRLNFTKVNLGGEATHKKKGEKMNQQISARWLGGQKKINPKMEEVRRHHFIAGLNPDQVATIRHLGNRLVGLMTDGSRFAIHL